MANYLSLEEAAAQLGISPEQLVDLRSQGQVRGFRDGASWKFPDSEIERLKDDLAAGGSGVLVNDTDMTASGSNIIGGDEGSDLGIGEEPSQPGSGSDVNLVASEGEGSDVAVVASDSDLDFESSADDLLEIDSGELQLQDPAIMHDSAQLDLAIEPNAGSTGPVTDEELKEIAESHPDVLAPEADGVSESDLLSAEPDAVSESDVLAEAGSGTGSGTSQVDIGDDIPLKGESDLSFAGPVDEEDSGEEVIGGAESDLDVIGSDIGVGGGSAANAAGASSLELMDSLDEPGDIQGGSRGADVLSELDLLSAEQEGSGLISGDSESLLASSGLGSSIGADALAESDLSSLEDDDALADDDDLVIADDDDDLVISSAGSDISVAGDSGINLMSPSDSGLSLESEPLDLAGSSISALDLGAELSEGGSSGKSGPGSDGSMVDFQADEEFQLSPSGVGLEADIESGSQVIEVEDSAIAEPVEFEEGGFADDMGGFAEEAPAEPVSVGDALSMGDDSVQVQDTAVAAVGGVAAASYEVPFTILQCITLVMIIFVLCMGGMLMTDLVRNMWSYAEPSAPVSSLTDWLISAMGWNP